MNTINFLKALILTFIANPLENLLHGTPDGNFFLEKDKAHALHHARTTGQKLTEYKREDYEKEIAEESKPPADDEALAAINALKERARAVKLPETATENEIVAAEKAAAKSAKK